MINDIRNITNFILNKESRGYITPFQFNSFAKQAQQEIVDSYFDEYNKYVVGKNLRSNVKELLKSVKESIDVFMVSPTTLSYNISTGLFVSPANLYFSTTLIYNENVEVEELPRDKMTYYLQDDFSGNSVFYPTYVKYNNDFKVYPSTIVNNIKLVYFRNPTDPNWTYEMFGDDAIFNPSGSGYQDFEVGNDDKFKLITKILKYCGINLRESEILQVVDSLNQNEILEKRN